MLKQSFLLALTSLTLACGPGFAQEYDTSMLGTSSDVNSELNSLVTAEQAAAAAAAAVAAAQQNAKAQAHYKSYNGLPPTSLDSFVANSGYSDLIYGDEGTDGLPPYFGFDASHRINSGIYSTGLTTGHGSWLPDAWGGDEFTGNEWSMSGSGQSASNLAMQALLNLLGLLGI